MKLPLYDKDHIAVCVALGGVSPFTDWRAILNCYQTNRRGRIEKLDLSSCQFPASALPESIGRLTELTWLDLWNTNIAVLPSWIGELKHLKRLDLSRTGLTTLPKEIGQLGCLQNLLLAYSKVTTLPEEIGHLKRLVYLDLEGTSLSREHDYAVTLVNCLPRLGFLGHQLEHVGKVAYALDCNAARRRTGYGTEGTTDLVRFWPWMLHSAQYAFLRKVMFKLITYAEAAYRLLLDHRESFLLALIDRARSGRG